MFIRDKNKERQRAWPNLPLQVPTAIFKLLFAAAVCHTVSPYVMMHIFIYFIIYYDIYHI